MSTAPENPLVVGIGASAGGVEALLALFAHIPATSGCAYVVIPHLSPEHESQLAAILQRGAAIPVTPVSGRVRVEADHAYVVPPSQHLTLADDELVVSPNTRPEERQSPIDLFFRTLADAHSGRAVCVVLSGAGADGALGLKRVKECGGAIFVQDPREAAFGAMPRSAIATGLADDVLPAAEIPARIAAYRARLDTLSGPLEPEQRQEGQQALREIFALLRSRTGNDFSDYKRPTLLRRIERRLSALGLADLAAYAAVLRDRPDETPALLTSLLISVTAFFRDPGAFAELEREVLPRIFAGKQAGDHIRIWAVGCATGEEAYSLAMLCAERATGQLSAPSVSVFATDIDEAAIARARKGLYTASEVAELSPERLRRFFVREDDRFCVRRELRERVLFATHNILKDPPFSRIDLIACRNVLIYLNRAAQQRVVERLSFALSPGGYLFLGPAEAPDGYGDLFVTVSREERIFQRQAAGPQPPRLPARRPPAPLAPPPEAPEAPTASARAARGPLIPIDLHQRLLEQYAPPSLIVTSDYEIVHVSPRAARYLRITAGAPSVNLLLVLRPELLALTHAALVDALKRQADVATPPVPLRFDDADERVVVRARPVLRPDDAARGYVLVLFEAEAPARGEAEALSRADEPATQLLQGEVARLRQELRTSSAQYEYQAEMLRSANEELQALNEELRTSGEELETSKEELQSVNEELHTVNQELKLKIAEATRHSTDLQNLVTSADVGTIFLDRGLRIKLFTPAAARLFNLIPPDRGRPLSDITHRMVEVDVLADAERVLSALQTVEREVRTVGDEVYLLRALPYRADDEVGGVVLTFFDITERQGAAAQAQAALEAERVARREAEAATERTAQLQAVTAGLADALTLAAVVGVIAEHGLAATGAAAVVVRALDAAGERLEVAGQVGREAAAAERPALPLGAQAPQALAARGGEPVWLASRGEAEARFPGFGDVLARYGEHALASLPLVAAERTVGTLSFAYGAPRTFAPEERVFLLALAQQCAQALERARLYGEVLASQEQLRQLSQRLLAVQEEERSHLARELHDELGQELTGLRLALELAERLPPEQRGAHLAEAHRTTQELIARVRALSLELRPVMLDDTGLLPALLWLIRRFGERTEIAVTLHHQGLERRLPPAVETVAYRVVQEALTNIARYAGVKAATVSLLASPARLLIQVQDSGRGFVRGEGADGSSWGGLAGMQERVALMGGTLSIETEPGRGTWLTVALPLGEEPTP